MHDSMDAIDRPSNPASSNAGHPQIEAIKDDLHLVKTGVKEMQKQVEDEFVELKDEVVELKEQVKVISAQLQEWHASGWKSWHSQWSPSTSGPCAGATSWSEGSTSGPSAADHDWI